MTDFNQTPRQIAPENKLTDEQVIEFIINGYHFVELDLPEGLNASISAQLDKLERNPLDEILDVVPELYDIYRHPKLIGALASLLGDDFQYSSHRHWHSKAPKSGYMHWHQDSVNTRDHNVRKVLTLYYPHDVTPDMGPTIVVPGTHYRNAPTDRMATYFNIRGQVPVVVKAGTVAITHYDIWHGTAPNRSDKPRHMIKVPVTRQTEPTAPTWNYDAERAKLLSKGGAGGGLSARMNTARPVPMGQTDHYKERHLRRQAFTWLCGEQAT